MKSISVFPARSRFPVKLNCYIAFGQYRVLVVYLNLLLSSYNNFGNKHNAVNSRLGNPLLAIFLILSYVLRSLFIG